MQCKDCHIHFNKDVKIHFDPFMQMVCAKCDEKIRRSIKQFKQLQGV